MRAQRRRRHLLYVIAAGLACAAAASAEDLTPDMRSEDTRLLRRVSLRAADTTVGRVLDEAGRATGVRVDADVPSGAACERVACSVSNLPMADLMSGLFGLLSYKGAAWHWDRSGKPGAYSYRLMQGLAAQRFPASLRDFAQACFEKQVDLLLQAVDMAPADREAFLRAKPSDPETALCAPDSADLKVMVQDGPRWAALRLFASLFPPGQRAEFLRSGTMRVVPISRAPEGTGALADQILRLAGSGSPMVNGRRVQPKVEAITFTARRLSWGVPPCLQIGPRCALAGIPTTFGVGMAGGSILDGTLKRWLREQWTLPGDSADDDHLCTSPIRAASPGAALAHNVPSDHPELAPGIRPTRPLPAAPFLDLAARVPLSVLVRLPPPDTPGEPPSPAAGVRVGDYLAPFNSDRSSPWAYKWRCHVLLIASHCWFRRQAGSGAP